MSAELAYLQAALTRTLYIDRDRMDFLRQVAIEVMDAWVAAGDDPVAIRELKKADFRIL